MRFHSTRQPDSWVSASQAIVQGLSDEGGLFVPETFPQVDVEQLCGLDYPKLAQYILSVFLTDYDTSFLTECAQQVYGRAFEGGAGLLRPVSEGLYSLELWHGPTCAFKDYALQIMPCLLVQAKRNLGRTEMTRILVATSGDTGKAALEGYRDVPGVQIAVFYPSHGTSEIQRLQMTTQEGANVAVYAVQGNFDDAQTGVKKVFANDALAKQLDAQGVCLSSANSINWGRLVPQIVYYFAAYGQLVRSGQARMGQPVDFCVPTGNFGDILAGYYAKRMGLPVGRLVCASNTNNVLTEFLSTGVYDARRKFYKTTSPSMDILVSSNLERLLYHITGDCRQVADYMESLARQGIYRVDPPVLAAIQQHFAAGFASDEEVDAEIARQYQEHHYLCDPHTAVAFKVAREQGGQAPMVVLSTASPFKFPKAVLRALGRQVPDDEFAAMALLEQAAGEPAPASLAGLRQKTERFTQSILPEDISQAALRV